MILKGFGEIGLPMKEIKPVKGSYIDGSHLRFHLGEAKLVVSMISDKAWVERKLPDGTIKKRPGVTTVEEREELSELFYREGF